jgi:acyl-CoA hydrolase
MTPKPEYTSAENAIRLVQSGNRIFIHGSAATPTVLVEELARQADRLKDVEVVSISVFGNFPIAEPGYEKSFHICSQFVSQPVREAVRTGRADYLPVFLSEIPDLFRNGILKLDAALVQVSVPDAHGYVSLGVSVDVARAAVNCATKVIALVNPKMPRTHGDGMIHISELDAAVFHDAPIHYHGDGVSPGETEMQIGRHVAELIDDGSTLQMGIGTIPDAVLSLLGNHKHLGVHTEMLSDGVINLIEKDVINNSRKKKHPGRTVTGFCTGTQRLYDYINDNPAFAFLDIDYVNDAHVIRQNPKVVAINSCIEIDLTGQVCSDSIGTYQYSGVGGQMDFMRGAALSDGGKPVIALPSRTGKGVPRIVSTLKEGASVVTTRAHVHYVVTEYGVAYLYGKTLIQRARELIRIAHPGDRDALERQCHTRFGRT